MHIFVFVFYIFINIKIYIWMMNDMMQPPGHLLEKALKKTATICWSLIKETWCDATCNFTENVWTFVSCTTVWKDDQEVTWDHDLPLPVGILRSSDFWVSLVFRCSELRNSQKMGTCFKKTLSMFRFNPPDGNQWMWHMLQVIKLPVNNP